MDEFEKFIKQNKSKFNDHKADTSKIWNAINLELDTPKTKVVPLWKSTIFKVAASVIIILGILTIVKLSVGISSDSSSNLANTELQEINFHYQKLIVAQVNLVKKNTNLSADNKEEFLGFIEELDKEYNTLIIDLNDNLDNELVLEAIVNNYKKRIELLENLLKQIKESKNNTDDNVYIL